MPKVISRSYSQTSMVIRWLILLIACIAAWGVGSIIEHELISRGWFVCPQGWWRESPGLCAFPFVSIITLSFAYSLKSLLLLIAVAILAPNRRFTSCIALLAILALWQIYVIIFIKLSWVAMVSLSGVIAIATCFILGTFVRHIRPSSGMC